MSKKINRRSFIKKAAIGIVTAEIGYLLYDSLKTKEAKEDSNKLFKVGNINSFEKDKMYPFTAGKFYLSILEDGGMLALSIKCTHLGCMVQVSKNGFECPCHASAFDKFGEVLSPPATRALDIFPIKIAKGEIVVDTNKPIRRKSFEKSQLTYA